MKWKYEKEYREKHPETIGETDREYDLDNYKDFLEEFIALALSRIEELEKERSEPTVGMVMAYEAGLSDRDQWRARCEAAEAYIKTINPPVDIDKALKAHKVWIKSIRAMGRTK